MIQTNELRIGNILQYAYKKEIAVVSTIHEEMIRIKFATHKLKDFKPIPLTPEVLEDVCGFVRESIQGFKLYSFDSKFCLFEIEGSFIFEPTQYKLKLEYLHELQNLFFTLRKEELKLYIYELKSKIQ